jgi:hypothetical protein
VQRLEMPLESRRARWSTAIVAMFGEVMVVVMCSRSAALTLATARVADVWCWWARGRRWAQESTETVGDVDGGDEGGVDGDDGDDGSLRAF